LAENYAPLRIHHSRESPRGCHENFILRRAKRMNPNNPVNSALDKHPFGTGTLFIMVIAALLILYGIFYVILKNKK
jgi:hypothetical protein